MWPQGRQYLAYAARVSAQWGLDARTAAGRARALSGLRRDRRLFARQQSRSEFADAFPMAGNYLIWEDRRAQAGQASGHYFHQDLLVARDVFARHPQRHVDVGSAIYGFVSHVASFREIDVIDVRPLDSSVEGIRFLQADLSRLDSSLEGITDSLSCLHALEHVGLGRYGDPVDCDGWLRGLESLTAMLTPGGRLYLSVPTSDRQRVEFNAHRVFSIPFLWGHLRSHYFLAQLAFVTDDGSLIEHVDLASAEAQASFGADYGCSIWFLDKR